MMDDLLDKLSLTMTGEPTSEGAAWRIIASRDDGRVVLYRWEDAAKARYVHTMYTSPQLGEQLFAIPEVLDADLEAGWMLVQAPDGLPLVDWLKQEGIEELSQLDPYKHRGLVESLGVLVRKLHSLDVPEVFGRIGNFDPESSFLPPGVFHTFNGWVAERLERYGEKLDELDILDEEQRLMSKEFLGDLRHELSSFHPRHHAVVTHGTIGTEHLWVSRNGQEVIGLTGFEHARYLSAEADNAYLLWHEGLIDNEQLVRVYYQGYGAARTMDVQRRERFYRRLVTFDMLCAGRTTAHHSPDDLLRLVGPSVT